MDKALLYEATLDWCPDFPRQCTYGSGASQHRVDDRITLVERMEQAAKVGGPGYASVYSFPRGHSRDANIPKIDTLFFDFDIPKSEGVYDPSEGGKTKNWQRDISKLLVRARMVARVIVNEDLAEHFRVALSGHKGIHLYIDFNPIDKALGPLVQYKNGISAYAKELIDFLEKEAGVELHNWIDVNSHDLGRLSRLPNTPHHGAQHVEHVPYCVPTTVEELQTIDSEEYLRLTRSPRQPPGDGRTPSDRATTKLTANIKDASDSKTSTPGTSKHRDEDVIESYQENSNDSLTAEYVRDILIQNKPCIGAWLDRDDAYEHGQSSRTMEINVIKELAGHDVPIEVMKDVFSTIPNYDAEYSEKLIKDIIARYYPSSFVCRNITEGASQFCLGDDCSVYRRNDDLEIE